MCMVASAVTKEFGVLASDSSMYDTDRGEMSFESNRLLIIDGKKIASFIGTHLYLANIDRSKLSMPFSATCLYLKDFFKSQKAAVAGQMKAAIADEDENKPDFCFFLMGLHNSYPTLAQFNSFIEFEPRYIWSSSGLKFASIIYGDDSKPEKAAMFKETNSFMEAEAKRLDAKTPGIVAEVLSRGIYHKADEEMKIGTKRKYAGGPTNAAMLNKNGVVSLSGFSYI